MTSSTSFRNAMTTDAHRWRAVETRDARFDDVFCYGTRSTGVFCRPSCASRPARRASVRFFASATAAAAAGFRPCKRCRPDVARAPLAARLEAVARHVKANATEPLPLALLAQRAALSPAHFQRAFKAHFGVTPRAFQDGVRLGRLKADLRGGKSVTAAIADAGYSSSSRVYGEASRQLGMTPTTYRAGGSGESVHYACRETTLGLLMMAATGRGVCFAEFGESREALVQQLAKEFPAATLEESSRAGASELDAWIRAFTRHLAGTEPRPDVPLDLRGTAFQVRVWRFLLGLAAGETVTYTAVAAAIGSPKAVRAAASACGANRIAVLIPCHRVLRGDGGLGGYRWGIQRKQALLDAERSADRSTPLRTLATR